LVIISMNCRRNDTQKIFGADLIFVTVPIT